MPAYFGAFSAGVTHRDRENRVAVQYSDASILVSCDCVKDHVSSHVTCFHLLCETKVPLQR